MKKIVLSCFLVLLAFGGEESKGKRLFSEGISAFKKRDFKKALSFFQKACDLNNRSSCAILGAMYDNGAGAKKNSFKAVELYQKACDLNEGRGCFNLGVMYEFGEGVKKDLGKALELYGKACDLKSELGCKNYAKLKQ